MRSRTLPTAIAAVLGASLLVACGGSTTSTSTGSSAATTSRTQSAAAASSGPIVAVLQAPGHSPHVGNFPITITLTKGGLPIAGHVSYEFLFQGQVVSRQQVELESPNFVGRFHDTLTWPANSVGYPLTLRIVITTPYGVKNVDYPVLVQR